MKKIFITICLSLSFGMVSAQQKNIALQKKIDSLLFIDQLVQQNLIKASQRNATAKAMDSLGKEVDNTFRRHIPLLKNIIAEYGLPTYSKVGQQSSDNFIIMVNHSFTDIPFQQQVIELAKEEVKNKNVSGNQVALLTDKMLIHAGQKQRYGTQCDYDANGNAVIKNLESPEKVDERRKEVGLNPLKEYLDFMTSLHKEMNKKQ